MSMTLLVQKLEKEIRNKRIKNGEIIENNVIKPVIYSWGKRHLFSDPESTFLNFKNRTLPLFKECIRNLFNITPSTEKENAEYLKTLDERINEANEVNKFDRTVIIRYEFEIGNGLVNLGFKKLLKDHLDLRKDPHSLKEEIDLIKKDVGFAVSRYVKSYISTEKSMFGPKGIYYTAPLGQAELKFAFDEIVKLKVSKTPLLPSLTPKNYWKIGIEDKSFIYDISRIMENLSQPHGRLRYFISKYGTHPLCYPNMCLDFLLEKDYELVGTYLNMIGYLEVPWFKSKQLPKPLEYVV